MVSHWEIFSGKLSSKPFRRSHRLLARKMDDQKSIKGYLWKWQQNALLLFRGRFILSAAWVLSLRFLDAFSRRHPFLRSSQNGFPVLFLEHVWNKFRPTSSSKTISGAFKLLNMRVTIPQGRNSSGNKHFDLFGWSHCSSTLASFRFSNPVDSFIL